jgi:hypothetical protein
MELQEFKTNKLAYEELLKVTGLSVREPNQEDRNRQDFANHIIVPGQPLVTKLLLAYLQKNEVIILEKLKNAALVQLKADKAQLILDNESQIATIKNEIL